MIENGRTTVSEVLRWALDDSANAAMASADWLATDINRSVSSAAELLCDSNVTLPDLCQAKHVFKTMRVVGETSTDRRVGARLYAASIAAGLVFRGVRISQQSDEAIRRAFQGLLDDTDMPQALRDLAGQALCLLPRSNRDN